MQTPAGRDTGKCIFVTDLHGSRERYIKLFELVRKERPNALFIGGDILPSGLQQVATLDVSHSDFFASFLLKHLHALKQALGTAYPRIFLILGNDDGRFMEPAVLDAAAQGLWQYVHNRHVPFGPYRVFGYAYIPPTPFALKDWERYDVSRYVDPGCSHPADGIHSHPVADDALRATIAKDLEQLTENQDLNRAIFLFHTPPYQTYLDRADLDGQMVDFAPLDVHVGSIAVQRFIQDRQPLITLHGHVHESVRLTGHWRQRIGRTLAFSAAHDGPELAVVRFDPSRADEAQRQLL